MVFNRDANQADLSEVVRIWHTLTNCSISGKSQFASTAVGANRVGAISVRVTWTGIRRALVNI